MKLVTIADEIMAALGDPTDISSAAVIFWLQSNIGSLNNTLLTSYTLSSNGAEISPELGHDEKDILKTMYFVYYYGKQIQSNLGAAAYDSVQEVSEDGFFVKKVNKNEVAKTYLSLKRAEMDNLTNLVNGYKLSRSGPAAVYGTDTFTESNPPPS